MALWSTLGLQWTCHLWICMLISMAMNIAAAQYHRGVQPCNTSNTTIWERKVPYFNSFGGANKCVTPFGWDYHILVSLMPDLFPKRDEKSHVTPSPWHASQHFGVISTKVSVDPLLTRCKDLARLIARGWWRQWRSIGGQWWQKICRTKKWSLHGQCAEELLSVVHVWL